MIHLYSSEEDLEDLMNGLKLISKGVETALMRALNKSITSVRAESVRMIRKDYNIKAKDIRGNLDLDKASVNRLQASMIGVASPGIPLYAFSPSPRRIPSTRRTKSFFRTASGVMTRGYDPKIGISVIIRRDKGRIPVKSAFIARMPSSHVDVFKRAADGRVGIKSRKTVIEKRFGPSAIKILASDKYEIPLEDFADETMEYNLQHEATYLMQRAGIL